MNEIKGNKDTKLKPPSRIAQIKKMVNLIPNLYKGQIRDGKLFDGRWKVLAQMRSSGDVTERKSREFEQFAETANKFLANTSDLVPQNVGHFREIAHTYKYFFNQFKNQKELRLPWLRDQLASHELTQDRNISPELLELIDTSIQEYFAILAKESSELAEPEDDLLAELGETSEYQVYRYIKTFRSLRRYGTESELYMALLQTLTADERLVLSEIPENLTPLKILLFELRAVGGINHIVVQTKLYETYVQQQSTKHPEVSQKNFVLNNLMQKLAQFALFLGIHH